MVSRITDCLTGIKSGLGELTTDSTDMQSLPGKAFAGNFSLILKCFLAIFSQSLARNSIESGGIA